MNIVAISGRLSQVPEQRYTQSGKTVCLLNVAVEDGWGEKKVTNFFRVVTWEKVAENCAAYLTKGQVVTVEGRLTTRQYEKDGVKHYITEIVARRVEFGAKPQGKNAQGTTPTGDNNFGPPIPDQDIPF